MEWFVVSGYMLIAITVFRFTYMRVREFNYQENKGNPNNVESEDASEAFGTATGFALFWPFVLVVFFVWKVLGPLARMILFPYGLKPKSQRRDEALAAKAKEREQLEAAIEEGRKLVEN